MITGFSNDRMYNSRKVIPPSSEYNKAGERLIAAAAFNGPG